MQRRIIVALALAGLALVPAAFAQAPALELHAPVAFSPDGDGVGESAAARPPWA